jgi:uncharacterized protein YcbK (DUF882 family)
MTQINWQDGNEKISKYFTVKDACYLPRLKKLTVPSEDQRKEILKLATLLDDVRDFLGVPLLVSNWLRTEEYNKLIGGSTKSQHCKGSAVDFVPQGITCTEAQEKLNTELANFGLCMERTLDTPQYEHSPWVHIDTRSVIPNSGRWFKV